MSADWPEHLAALPRPLNRGGTDAGNPAARFGFLLVPGYTAIGFTCAVESLRTTNMAARKQLFEAFTTTLDGAPVRASNGVASLPDCTIANAPPFDIVLVCGPNPILYPHEKTLIRWLWRLAERGVALGGICTGSYLLARAGLLDGYRCTIHWQDMETLRERFPELIVSPNIFEIDRDRFTCTGGTASMDMMLHLLGERFADETEVALACDLLISDRLRDSRERQRVPLRHRVGPNRKSLSQAVTLMEANIEEPLTQEELAGYVELSSRQLQRLFHDHLNCTPGEYYMRTRLTWGHQLLLTTDLSIIEIANRCGFSSPSHFTRRYTGFFGRNPHTERQSAIPAPEAEE